MDLRVYYQKVRETFNRLPDGPVVVVSLATGDGGKPGVYTETPKEVAAKMIVDGSAEEASAEAAAAFRLSQAQAKLRAEAEVAATKVPLSLISTAELNRLRVGRDQE